VDHHHPAQDPLLQGLEIPPAWEEAARLFLKRGGITMVLGAGDTGKSTLCRYLVDRAFRAGEATALVDLDLGQSHLGPPAALGLALFPPLFPGDAPIFPHALVFVGQTSPAGAVLEVVVGCRVLVDRAQEQGVSRVVVNTSGFVYGGAALRLKRAQLELLRPRLLLALARGGELAPLMDHLTGGDPAACMLLPVSSRAVRKTMEERRWNREARFQRFFEPARPLTLPLAQVRWQGLPWGRGAPLDGPALESWTQRLGTPVFYGETSPSRTVLLVKSPVLAPPLPPPAAPVHCLSWPSLKWRLLGLQDQLHRTLSLGLLFPSPWREGAVTIWTPLDPGLTSQVRCLKVGKMRVSPAGRELQ